MTDTDSGAEYVTAGEAQKLLGVTGRRMAAILASGDLEWRQSRLNRRIKWIRRADVEAYAKQLRELRPVHPKSGATSAATSAA